LIVFILNAYHIKAADQTAASAVGALQGSRIVRVHMNAAEQINRIIAACEDEFFLTLHAGELLLPAFEGYLRACMSQISAETGWISFTTTVSGNRSQTSPVSRIGGKSRFSDPMYRDRPVLWKKACVQERTDGMIGGFPTMDWLPFESYMLIDTMLQSEAAWTGITKETDLYVTSSRPIPTWQQARIERELVLETLSRPLHIGTTVSPPVVTIVLCSYNDAPYLLWAIRSVLTQTCKKWELIIVDDGSTDETAQKLAMLPKDARIQVIRHEINLGKSQSLNTALVAAQGHYLLELDADDWLTPDCVAYLLKAAEPCSDETALWYGQNYVWQERANKQLVYSGLHIPPTSLNQQQLLKMAAPLAPRLYRTAALRQIGGWLLDDPFGGRLYEDFAIILRMEPLFGIKYVARGLYHRRNRAQSITHRFADRYEHWMAWAEMSGRFTSAEKTPSPSSPLEMRYSNTRTIFT
jgi:glycosyltransferase involved in cell wall biosynthesis